MGIYSVMVVNNSGAGRLTKFYNMDDLSIQLDLVQECFRLVSKRSPSLCNFIEPKGDELYVKTWGEDVRLIYRHFATLFFIFAVDKSESELGILDLIQVFVEALDKCFENVCELDLIFHHDKVHFILDEIVMNGMVLETSLREIVSAVNRTQQYEEATKNLANPRKTTIGNLPSASGLITSLKMPKFLTKS